MIAPALVIIRLTCHPAPSSSSTRRTPYCAPEAPVIATTASGMDNGHRHCPSMVAYLQAQSQCLGEVPVLVLMVVQLCRDADVSDTMVAPRHYRDLDAILVEQEVVEWISL